MNSLWRSKFIKWTLLTIFCLFGMTSCWFGCAPAIYGIVVDDNTGELLDSVKVDFYEEGEFSQSLLTDSTGRFSFSADPESVFMFEECERDFNLKCSIIGYADQEFQDNAPSVEIIIRLIK